MARIEYSHIMTQLKRILRKQGATYATLAKSLDVPESTIKKWFTSKDGSFERISRISEALGVSIAHVMKALEEESVKTFSFTTAQQQYFLKEPLAFKIFWLLVYLRQTPQQIQLQFELNEKEIQKILLRLDKLNLIIVGARDVVKLPRMRPIRWQFSGPFMEKIQEKWTKDLLREANSEGDSSRSVLQFYQLSEEALEDFHKDVRALEERYARRTIMELNGPKKGLRLVRYLSAVAEGSFIKNDD